MFECMWSLASGSRRHIMTTPTTTNTITMLSSLIDTASASRFAVHTRLHSARSPTTDSVNPTPQRQDDDEREDRRLIPLSNQQLENASSPSSIPEFASTSGGGGGGIDTQSDNGDRDDCPVCREYLDGPCGTQFQEWLDCTDRHREDHVEQCRSHFDALHQCLERHDDDGSDNDEPRT